MFYFGLRGARAATSARWRADLRRVRACPGHRDIVLALLCRAVSTSGWLAAAYRALAPGDSGSPLVLPERQHHGGIAAVANAG